MAVPAFSRVLRYLRTPGGVRVRVLVRARSSRVPPEPPPAQAGWDLPERFRLRAREQKEKRKRLKREREERETLRGSGSQVPPPLPKGWPPKSPLEYKHPLHPDGKKDTGGPLPPSYSPRYVEAAWYGWWESLGVFTPPKEVPGGGRVLSLVLPPPNVTGTLHVGHALTVALQDTLVRWRRMQGWAVMWLPGTDHAGIATQAVVERWLWQQRGLRRTDLSRSEFLQEVWRWKERHGDEILGQLRALGASLDWSRCAFTMDPAFSRAVVEAFVRLHRAGLIRRDRRVVTWCPTLRCALADLEVEPRSLTGPTALSLPGCPQPVTFGVLFTFAYPVEGDDGLELLVATTRPETILGDVAVAVNPEDPRYTHLHGRRVRNPLSGSPLPIIRDPSVEPSLGTGAVKVTPGHSPQDLVVARAHGLPLLGVIGDDGTMCPPGGGWLQGVPRFQAREEVVAALAQRGLFRGCQDHPMTVPICSRSGDVVEHLLKSQWFLSCQEMAQRAQEAVTSGELQLVPKFHEKSWRTWMENVGDWCLSRQLWWGHRVPAYWVGAPQDGGDPPEHPQGLWVSGRSREEAEQEVTRALGGPLPGDRTLHQDPDVLDTWFSSALFPFAALGWPQESPDLQRFYPSSLLGTGRDLLFFWVARMAMLGQQLTGHLPFPRVLLHSLVRDSRGRKMSKSLGNVIDPRDVITGATPQELQQKLREKVLDPQELLVATKGQAQQFPHGIPECGADALRMALCSYNAQGDDLRLDVPTLLAHRHFCNKVWNALRFVLGALGPPWSPRPPEEAAPEGPMERWVLSRLARAAGECGRRLEALEVQGALGAVQNFWLRSFCDVYLVGHLPSGVLRATGGHPDLLKRPKPTLQDPSRAPDVRRTLLACSDLGLRLLSPLCPPSWPRSCGSACPGPPPVPPHPLPRPLPRPPPPGSLARPELEAQVSAILEMARAARGLRETFRLGAARPPRE
ncbi:valine--tRNA ligase, mitochondrial [Heliangelus exortis]|uniref:valine--tRNA ligase, mitochondrial n=1 Tax=Heliangelus exortis TaxID=472823 RepID=UPI003A900824